MEKGEDELEKDEKNRGRDWEDHQGDKHDEGSIRSSGLDAITLCSQLGLTIAVPIILGMLGGNWLDKKLGTGHIFFLILLTLGIVAGFVSAYRQIMGTIGKKK